MGRKGGMPALLRATANGKRQLGITLGKNARKEGTYGDIHWWLQYVNDEESLVMARDFAVRNPSMIRNPGAVVIGLSSAWKYMADTPEAAAYLTARSCEFAEIMGFDAKSRKTVFRISELIQKMLIELINMKPIPDAMREQDPFKVADIQISDQGVPTIILEKR